MVYKIPSTQRMRFSKQWLDLIHKLDYGEHYRWLSASYCVPEDGFTSGVDNCYWTTAGLITHHKNSKTQGKWNILVYKIPDDWVSDTDIMLNICLRMISGANPDSIDYRIQFIAHPDGAVNVTMYDIDSTWLQDWSGNLWWNKRITSTTNSDLSPGDFLRMAVSMEDNDNVTYIQTFAGAIRILVNSRD